MVKKQLQSTLLLSLFLLAVVLGGCVLAGTLPQEELQLLQEFLLSRSVTEAVRNGSLWHILWAYLRVAAVLLLFSCSAVAVVPVLALCTLQPLCLSFAVSAFARAMGREGLLLALAALGLRCLFCLPGMLYLATAVLRAAVNPSPNNRAALVRCAVISCSYLLLGAVLEMTVSPILLRYFFS